MNKALLAVQVEGLSNLQGLLTHSVSEKLKENGWAALSAVGSYIGKNATSFDARNDGFTKLGGSVRAQPYLEVREMPDAAGTVHLNVRVVASSEKR